MNTREAVRQYRAAKAALRGIARNKGRTRATSRAIAHHYAAASEIENVLISSGRARLAADLLEESKLTARIAESAREGAERPELTERRRELRRRIAAAAAGEPTSAALYEGADAQKVDL